MFYSPLLPLRCSSKYPQAGIHNIGAGVADAAVYWNFTFASSNTTVKKFIWAVMGITGTESTMTFFPIFRGVFDSSYMG